MNQQQIAEVERIIGYEFHNKELLMQAYTRRSYTEENRGELNNELLETIGDVTIGFYVTRALVAKYKADPFLVRTLKTTIDESDLTRMRKELVCGKNLAKHAKRLGLANPDYMRMSKGERQDKIYNEQKAQEDLLESIVGAVTVDIDFRRIEPEFIFMDMTKVDGTVCQKGLITRLLELDSPKSYNVRPMMDTIGVVEENLTVGNDNFNSINYLLELYQARKIPFVEYIGSGNENNWTCSASIPEKGLTFSATAKSKKEAKLLAAKKLYKAITKPKITLKAGDWVQVLSDDYEEREIFKGMIGKIIAQVADGEGVIDFYEPNDDGGYNESDLIVSGCIKEKDLQIICKQEK